jgi:superoxide dismutase, Fe-Mn family
MDNRGASGMNFPGMPPETADNPRTRREAMSQLSRRQALTAAAAGVATLALGRLSLTRAEEKEKPAGYVLPKLPYDYDALKVSIDEETMKIHHTKHHQAYVTNANNLLKDHPELLKKPVEELLSDVTQVPEKIRQGVINNAGGHSNHSIFWTIMGPEKGKASGELSKAIDKAFESLDKFQKELSAKAVTQFGSGWAWLVLNKKKELEIVQRSNQDSPFMAGLTPILGIDVWEHAYYLKYKNARPDYVKAWWNVVDWSAVSDRYSKAMK